MQPATTLIRVSATLRARAVTIGVAALFVVMIVLAGFNLPLAAVLVGLTVVMVLAALHPAWLFPLFLVTAFASMPDVVPRVFPLLGVGIYLYEPFLYAAVLYLAVRRPHIKLPVVFTIFALLVVYLLVVGLFRGNAATDVVADVRPLVDLLAGTVGGYLYLKRFPLQPVLLTTKVILWVSVALTLSSSLLGLALSGRTEIASLTGAQTGAERLITAATYFSLAVVCLSLAAVITGSARMRTIMPYVLPALTILVLSFSRNHLLAIAVTLIWVVLSPRAGARADGSGSGIKLRGVARLTSLAVILAVLVASAAWSGAFPWLQEQITGFSDRVLSGLTADARQADASSLFRLSEIDQILPVIGQAPIFGQGAGATYKDAYGAADSFYATRAPAYAHHFYLWLMLKGGVVALVVFLALVLTPVVISVRSHNAALHLLAAALLAFLVVSVVAPMPIGFPTSVLFGLLIGAAHHNRDVHRMSVGPTVGSAGSADTCPRASTL